MPSLLRRSLIALAAAAPFAIAVTARTQPSAADWSALAALPDFSGVWVPDVADQRRKERNERPPWTPAAKEQIDLRPGRLLPRSDTGRRQGHDLQRRASDRVTA